MRRWERMAGFILLSTQRVKSLQRCYSMCKKAIPYTRSQTRSDSECDAVQPRSTFGVIKNSS